jgi:hypothetical protein
MPSPFALIGGSFFVVVPMSSIPCIQKKREPASGNPSQRCSDLLEISGRFGLGVPGQIADENLLLMEVAHLNGQVFKKPIQSPSSIDCDRQDLEPFGFQFLSESLILFQRFCTDKPEGHWLHHQSILGNQDTEFLFPLSEVGGIDHQDDGTWLNLRNRVLIVMDPVLDPLPGSAILSGKLFEGMVVIEVFFEKPGP